MRIFFIFFLFLTFSCTKEEVKVEPIYTEEEFKKVTEHLTQLNPIGENAIPYIEYSRKVNKLLCKTFIYERLKFYAIGFDTVEDARNEAIRLNQYYSKNYVLDQVEGEPILEDVAITMFKAINPNRKIQRVPKKSEHGESHGDAHGNSHGEKAEGGSAGAQH